MLSADGKMLLGTHIAGSSKKLCVMLPAWQLMSPRSYQFAGNQGTWALWNA